MLTILIKFGSGDSTKESKKPTTSCQNLSAMKMNANQQTKRIARFGLAQSFLFHAFAFM